MSARTLLAACALLLAARPAASQPMVALQPLGEVPPSLVAAVARHLETLYAIDVVEMPRRALPASAYHRPRRRYRGERLLRSLEEGAPRRAVKVLGVTARDVSVTRGRIADWGVMGVARLAGRPAVVSTYRLSRRGASRATVERRLAQVAAHELAHAFGVPHCPARGCIMADARGGMRAVDGSSGRFCIRCARRLGAVLRPAGGAVAGGRAVSSSGSSRT